MLVLSSKSNLGCEAGCGLTVSWSDHSRIMVGSWSDHSRIVPALEMTFHLFSANFCQMLGGHCVAGAVFGDVGRAGLLLRAL